LSNNPLDRIPAHDRVSLRAVVVPHGVDPGPALAQAGFIDPIALPMWFGEGHPDATFGDGITPNLTAVLEHHGPDAFGPDDGSHDPRFDRHDGGAGVDTGPYDNRQPPAGPSTATLPAAYGLQPLAPVRRSGWGEQVWAGAQAALRALNPIAPAQAAELRGYAIYYNLPGSPTASGEPFNPDAMNAAMTSNRAPLGTNVQVQLQKDPSSSITVRTNDTGPFAGGADGKPDHPLHPDPNIVIDLTPHAVAMLTGNKRYLGKVPVIVTVPDHK
jgi:hypothetical protein